MRMVPAVGLSRVVRVALVVLVLAVLQLPQSEARTKDIGEHGKRDSKYYKWQRDKEEVAAKAAQAKERQLAREAEGERGPKVDLSAEEKELQQLRRAITRKEQYKREAIEAENFEEAARLRDEISDAKREVEQLQAAVKASSEQCKEDVDEGDDEGEVEEDEELVVGTDGIEIAAASEGEEEDYTSRCPDGYYDHDKNHVTPCEPINDPDIAKLETMVVHLEDIAYEFKYLEPTVAPIVSRVKTLKDSLLESGFVVATHGHDTKARGSLGTHMRPKSGHVANGETQDTGLQAQQEAVELMAGRELLEAINSTALLRPNVSETPARESQLAQAKVEVQGGLGQLLTAWAKPHVDSHALVPRFTAPLMTKEQLTEAQTKKGKLKAKSATQLYGWVCPSCPDSRGEQNSRGRWVLALPRDVEQRLGTLYVTRRQRVTIDGHDHSWAPQELIMSQNNERRFEVKDGGRLKLIRLIVRDAALSTVGHGGAILVAQGGTLEVERSQFRTNIARSQGGAIAVEGAATLVGSSFVANHAFGNGGAIYVGFNAPGMPKIPPTLIVKDCDFLDNIGKGGLGHAVHFGKSSPRQGNNYDNGKQLSFSA